MPAIPQWQRIAVTRDGPVTVARLHTSDQSLVFDATVHREMMEFATWLKNDAQSKVLILTGTGADFCTSIDIASYRTSTFHNVWVEGRRGPFGLLDLDIPMISVVNGPVYYHSELVVVGDIVLGCPETSFADHAHFTQGIVPGDGVQIVWPRLLGPSRATYFLMTGAVLPAEEALRLGVIHELHPRDQLLERARELATPMAALPIETLMYTKAALRSAERRLFVEEVSHGLALAGLEMHLTGKRAFIPPATAR